MAVKPALRTSLKQLAGMKLARLFTMSDAELAREAAGLEAKPQFAALTAAGAVRVTAFPRAFFATRKFSGLSLAARATGLAEILDGKSDLVRLLRRVGRRKFEQCFLGGERMRDAERAKKTGLTSAEVRRVRDFINRMYVRETFADPAPAAPVVTFSTVAGIGVAGGRPVLQFFNREVWKGRYHIDAERAAACCAGLDPTQRERVRRLLSRLELIDRRKTTLYQVLECLLQAQAAYFLSGDPADRQPLTQRALAVAVDSEPSVINRLLARKAVELPWGVEAPLRVLCPSAKSLARETVAELAAAAPQLSDEGLCRTLAERYRIHLSRRSVAQYRKESGLGGRGRR
ncbi:MAG: hypothetical protein ABIJ96_16020 [Elusimicrobiota bacterium]